MQGFTLTLNEDKLERLDPNVEDLLATLVAVLEKTETIGTNSIDKTDVDCEVSDISKVASWRCRRNLRLRARQMGSEMDSQIGSTSYRQGEAASAPRLSRIYLRSAKLTV
jgi:hypothetical protein